MFRQIFREMKRLVDQTASTVHGAGNRLLKNRQIRPADTPAIQRLGALEHLFWLYDQNSSVHFAVTALICGRTSPRDWRRALDRSRSDTL
jgi:hypothetical protein